MKKILAALIIFVAACGGPGGGNNPPPPTVCAPSGTWVVTDTKTGASGGVCASLMVTPIVSTIQVAFTSPTTFTWLENGVQFAGTINLGTCSGTVVGSLTAPASGFTITETINRQVKFDGNNGYSGTGGVDLSAVPPQIGLPCSITFTSAGARL